MPIFFHCSLDIPIGIIKQLERIQGQCPWRKFGNGHAPSLAAWGLVCRPKNKGSLGVLNLRIHNEAMLLKIVSKFYNKSYIPWVNLLWDTYYHDRVPHATILCGSFWWRDLCKLMDKFRMVSKVQVLAGDTALFWGDDWNLNHYAGPLDQVFQRLFSFVKDPLLSVKEVFATQDITTLFHLPLSERAHSELLSL